MRHRALRIFVCAFLALAVSAGAAAQEFSILHSFDGVDGGDSKGSMIFDNGVLYGFTAQGGNANTNLGNGTLFYINPDGSNFNSYFTFTDSDGTQPHHGHMLAYDGALYRPNLEGAAGGGELFSVTPDGGNYTALHVYQQSTGWESHSGVILGPDNLMYGLTADGGDNNMGTVYFYDPATDNHHHFFSFNGTTGSDPHGELIFDSTGQYLIGMNRQGGANGNGDIFRLNPFAPDITSTYQDLFDLGNGNLSAPGFQDHGTLTLIGTTIYGLTQLGGANDKGAIFSLSETGGPATLLHSFDDHLLINDGKEPYGSLTLVNGVLYGMTRDGGADDLGTIFRINPDGSDYEVLFSFSDATGANPIDDLTANANGTILYGLTQVGGANDPDGSLGYGTIFAFAIPEPSACAIGGGVAAAALVLLRRRPPRA